jgi:hypothetical protein
VQAACVSPRACCPGHLQATPFPASSVTPARPPTGLRVHADSCTKRRRYVGPLRFSYPDASRRSLVLMARSASIVASAASDFVLGCSYTPATDGDSRSTPPLRQKRAGTIVSVSSMGRKIYAPLSCWYRITKHALEEWSDCLHFKRAPFSIGDAGFILAQRSGIPERHLCKNLFPTFAVGGAPRAGSASASASAG